MLYLEGSSWFPGACLLPTLPASLSPRSLLLSVQCLREHWKARVGGSLGRAASVLPFGKLKRRRVKLQGPHVPPSLLLCSQDMVQCLPHRGYSRTTSWKCAHLCAHTYTIWCNYRELNSLDGFKENDKPLVQLDPFSKPGGRAMISQLSGVSSHSE